MTGQGPAPARADRFVKIGRWLLVGWLLWSFFAQVDMGVADNGDYTRFMPVITSGPVGVPDWPPADSPASIQRFFQHWLPYWRLDWPLRRPVTSVVLLWIPGALLNALVFSRHTLWMPILGLPIRLALLASLWVLFTWIDSRAPRHRLLLTVTLAAPMTLLLSTTDYVVFINTFYREAGTVAYLLGFLVSLLWLRMRADSWRRWCVCVVLLGLLTTAKAANAYWPFVGVPVLMWMAPIQVRWRYLPFGAAIAAVLAIGATRLMADHTNAATVWDSFFSSALLMSAQPAAHLDRLHMADAGPCIGAPSFVGVGRDCYIKYGDRVTVRTTLGTLAREPAIVVRQLVYGARALQDLSIEWYGVFASGDPHARGLPVVEGPMDRPFWGARSDRLLNAWSYAQYHWFPRGWAALAFLAGLMPICWFGARGNASADLAIVGVVSTLAIPVDILVEVVGEGRQDLVRHLFQANVLFAVAAIAAVSVVALNVAERVVRKRPNC